MDEISFDDFLKLDIKIGTVTNAEKVEDSDKLLKLEVTFNDFKRTVVAGIGDKYSPEEILNKQIPLLLNLKPRVIKGIESQGMILAVGNKNVEALLLPSENVENGALVH